MEIIIPVVLSLLLGPGVGQLYNKEIKKGCYLIGLSLVVLIGAIAWFRSALMPYLPPDLSTTDPAALPGLMQNAVTKVTAAHPVVIFVYEAMLFVLWLYSAVDAYRGAKRKQQKS